MFVPALGKCVWCPAAPDFIEGSQAFGIPWNPGTRLASRAAVIPGTQNQRSAAQLSGMPRPRPTHMMIRLGVGALVICAVTAALLKDRTDTQASPPARPGEPPPTDPMIPLTVAETARLLAAQHTRSARPRRVLADMETPPPIRSRW
jgi:hypothetical protein